ncbi:MAG: bacteriochlorophyll 4-vinyl reductase [Telmatospirillum sp.]|nr:bacteriochlorophyll 4-vinyl reductase [Telmatospirillum sp.]
MRSAPTPPSERGRTGDAKAGQGPATAGRVGPNAVIQVIAALERTGLASVSPEIFLRAGVSQWLARPPAEMIDETGAAGLHYAVRTVLSPDQAAGVLTLAGTLTADYLLANRIPRLARTILGMMPSPLAARRLVRAIDDHAWTFAGSGYFRGLSGNPTIVEILGNPLCARDRDADLQSAAPDRTEGVCFWHAAVFQRLFAVLVSPSVRVREVTCEARGGACCRFEIVWS